MREASALIYKAGNWAEGQHNRPLAVPKICFGLERRQILTAAPSSPRFICHRQRIGDDARHASCLGLKFLCPLTKRRTPLLRCSSFGRGRRTICNCPSETLSHSFPWSGCCALCFFPSLASLPLPPGAVGSSPRHASCRGFKPFSAPTKKKKHRFLGAFFLAGAEGLEPSARGFGDRCSTN